MSSELRKEIYNYERKVNRHLERIHQHKEISDYNKRKISEYIRYCEARGISKARQLIILQRLYKLVLILKKDFDKCQRADIETLLVEINKFNYTLNTVETLKKVVKAFWRWLHGLAPSDPLPDSVRWIQGSSPVNNIRREDLLTQDEIAELINATPHLMWKTMISVLYESACRPSELLTLQLKDVYVNKDYVKLFVAGKMRNKQGERNVFLLNSYDLIVKWLDTHPLRRNKQAPLWITNHGKQVPITLHHLNKSIKQIASGTSITKRIYPYLFRHSRGTQMYLNYGSSVAKKAMGHAQDTRMERVYSHMVDDDVLESLLGRRQIHEVKEQKCLRCNHFSQLGASRCSQCGIAFKLEDLRTQEDVIKETVMDVLKSLGMEVNLKK